MNMQILKEDSNEEMKQFEEIAKELCELRSRKNKDYGNSWKVFGLMGVVYQLGSKFIRTWNLLQEDKKPKNEPLEDSFKDLAVYGIMAIQLIRNKETEPLINKLK